MHFCYEFFIVVSAEKFCQIEFIRFKDRNWNQIKYTGTPVVFFTKYLVLFKL